MNPGSSRSMMSPPVITNPPQSGSHGLGGWQIMPGTPAMGGTGDRLSQEAAKMATIKAVFGFNVAFIHKGVNIFPLEMVRDGFKAVEIENRKCIVCTGCHMGAPLIPIRLHGHSELVNQWIPDNYPVHQDNCSFARPPEYGANGYEMPGATGGHDSLLVSGGEKTGGNLSVKRKEQLFRESMIKILSEGRPVPEGLSIDVVSEAARCADIDWTSKSEITKAVLKIIDQQKNKPVGTAAGAKSPESGAVNGPGMATTSRGAAAYTSGMRSVASGLLSQWKSGQKDSSTRQSDDFDLAFAFQLREQEFRENVEPLASALRDQRASEWRWRNRFDRPENRERFTRHLSSAEEFKKTVHVESNDERMTKNSFSSAIAYWYSDRISDEKLDELWRTPGAASFGLFLKKMTKNFRRGANADYYRHHISRIMDILLNGDGDICERLFNTAEAGIANCYVNTEATFHLMVQVASIAAVMSVDKNPYMGIGLDFSFIYLFRELKKSFNDAMMNEAIATNPDKDRIQYSEGVYLRNELQKALQSRGYQFSTDSSKLKKYSGRFSFMPVYIESGCEELVDLFDTLAHDQSKLITFISDIDGFGHRLRAMLERHQQEALSDVFYGELICKIDSLDSSVESQMEAIESASETESDESIRQKYDNLAKWKSETDKEIVREFVVAFMDTRYNEELIES